MSRYEWNVISIESQLLSVKDIIKASDDSEVVLEPTATLESCSMKPWWFETESKLVPLWRHTALETSFPFVLPLFLQY